MVINGDERWWMELSSGVIKHGCDITKVYKWRFWWETRVKKGYLPCLPLPCLITAGYSFQLIFPLLVWDACEVRKLEPRHLAKSWSWGRLSQRFLCWIISSALTSTLLAASWHEIHPGTRTLSLFRSDSQGKEWTETVKLYCKWCNCWLD